MIAVQQLALLVPTASSARRSRRADAVGADDSSPRRGAGAPVPQPRRARRRHAVFPDPVTGLSAGQGRRPAPVPQGAGAAASTTRACTACGTPTGRRWPAAGVDRHAAGVDGPPDIEDHAALRRLRRHRAEHAGRGRLRGRRRRPGPRSDGPFVGPFWANLTYLRAPDPSQRARSDLGQPPRFEPSIAHGRSPAPAGLRCSWPPIPAPTDARRRRDFDGRGLRGSGSPADAGRRAPFAAPAGARRVRTSLNTRGGPLPMRRRVRVRSSQSHEAVVIVMRGTATEPTAGPADARRSGRPDRARCSRRPGTGTDRPVGHGRVRRVGRSRPPQAASRALRPGLRGPPADALRDRRLGRDPPRRRGLPRARPRGGRGVLSPPAGRGALAGVRGGAVLRLRRRSTTRTPSARCASGS